MANSVEGRVPYLDHRVIEFAGRLPQRYKLRALKEKALLREALRPLLPQSIVKRVKQPYRAPDARSFFIDGKPLDYVAELLSEQRLHQSGYFNPEMARRLMEKCRTDRAMGFADNMAFLGMLSTMLVDDIFVRRSSVTGG
jgi:asparagine synthase (glutamine-hydrolysing)